MEGSMEERSTASSFIATTYVDLDHQESSQMISKSPNAPVYYPYAEPTVQQQNNSMNNADTMINQQMSDQGFNIYNENALVRSATLTYSPLALTPSSDYAYPQYNKGRGDNKPATVTITPQRKLSKNLDYIVGGATTKSGKTLYCKAETMVPFTFTFNNECDRRSYIHVCAEYAEERYMNKAVERCANHIVKDATNMKMHFVRCEREDSEYLGSDERYALRIPLCGSTNFMFTCFNSCAGGINRRPIQLTFALVGIDESRVEICKIPLKVCANPLRDASKEDGSSGNISGTLCSDPAVQRKRPQEVGTHVVVGVDLSKRPRYPVGTCHLLECHFTDERMVNKCLWFLANQKKFDKMLGNLDVDENASREVCADTVDTTIREWLNKRNIGFASLVCTFEHHSIFTLGDLARIYQPETFAHFGFNPNQCAVLNKAFQDWYNGNRANATEYVEVNSFNGNHPWL